MWDVGQGKTGQNPGAARPCRSSRMQVRRGLALPEEKQASLTCFVPRDIVRSYRMTDSSWHSMHHIRHNMQSQTPDTTHSIRARPRCVTCNARQATPRCVAACVACAHVVPGSKLTTYTYKYIYIYMYTYIFIIIIFTISNTYIYIYICVCIYIYI